MATINKKSADYKPNTQKLRQKKYNTILSSMQEGSQRYKVMKHMIQRGHTSSLEIQTLFYITNPTAVISDLRKKGAVITAARIEPKDKKKKPYYRLTLEV